MRKRGWRACLGLALLAGLLTYLCQRPSTTPPEPEAPEPAAPRSDSAGAQLTLIDRILAAHGGESNLARLQALTFTSEGTIDFYLRGFYLGRHRLHEVMAARMPDRWWIESTASGNRVVKVLLGDRGWLKHNVFTTREMTPDEVAEGQVWFFLLRLTRTLLPLKDPALRPESLGEREIAGKALVGMRIHPPGLKPIILQADRRTSLLARVETSFVEQAGKKIPLQFVFSEYKHIEGVQFYTRVVVQREGKAYRDDRFTHIEVLASLPDERFAKP